MDSLDIDHLKTWIGQTETVEDQITASLIDRFRATFFDKLWPTGDDAPLGLHWCLAPPAAPGNALGPDGHPKRGGFLPPVPLPSRMWAGGELTFHEPLRVGDRVARNSRIENVTLKQGKSGPLVFVTIEHQCSVEGQLAVAERQDIVYKRAAAKPSNAPIAKLVEPPPADALTVGPVELFRYSALTFNGHRIHYDREYAQVDEGYPGLVVHGPFQGTLLMNRAAQLCGSVPARFSFRGLAPLFDQSPFWLREKTTADGGEVWCEGPDRKVTMKAEFSAR